MGLAFNRFAISPFVVMWSQTFMVLNVFRTNSLTIGTVLGYFFQSFPITIKCCIRSIWSVTLFRKFYTRFWIFGFKYFILSPILKTVLYILPSSKIFVPIKKHYRFLSFLTFYNSHYILIYPFSSDIFYPYTILLYKNRGQSTAASLNKEFGNKNGVICHVAILICHIINRASATTRSCRCSVNCFPEKRVCSPIFIVSGRSCYPIFPVR